MSQDFAKQVELVSQSIRKLKTLDVQVQGGHLVGNSLMISVSVADFDRLAENGHLSDVSIKKTSPVGQISYHSTAVNEGALTGFNGVRIMAISITAAQARPADEVRKNPDAISIDAYIPFDAERTRKHLEARAERSAAGLAGHEKRLEREAAQAQAAEEDVWPVPF
jgi:hypothetical protein